MCRLKAQKCEESVKNALFLLESEALKRASFGREGLDKSGSRMKTPGGNERKIWIIKLGVVNTLPMFDSDWLGKANPSSLPANLRGWQTS